MIGMVMKSTGGRFLGCGLFFFGSIYSTCLIALLLGGDTFELAHLTASATLMGIVAIMLVVGVVVMLLAASYASRERYEQQQRQRKRRETLEQIRRRLEQRGPWSDEVACESVPIEARPFFLNVQGAVADFFGCRPESLRASDSLENDYEFRRLGWATLDYHVIDRLLGGSDWMDPYLVYQPAQGTLADLAEHVRKFLDARSAVSAEPTTEITEATESTSDGDAAQGGGSSSSL